MPFCDTEREFGQQIENKQPEFRKQSSLPFTMISVETQKENPAKPVVSHSAVEFHFCVAGNRPLEAELLARAATKQVD